MGGIPVLNDSQMSALRRIVGTNQKFKLVPTGKEKTRRLPVYDNNEVVGGGEVIFGVLTTGCSGASGAAGFTPATLGEFGEVTTSGEEVAVIVPRLQ